MGKPEIISGRGSGYCFIIFVFDLATAQMPRRKAKQYPMVEIASEGIWPDENPPSSKCARRE
jgi:hypothetical protein